MSDEQLFDKLFRFDHTGSSAAKQDDNEHGGSANDIETIYTLKVVNHNSKLYH